jgi:hypothetical protein
VRHARKLGTHLGVNLVTEETIECHELLQGAGAMLDWIAAPNFLAAYRQALKSACGTKRSQQQSPINAGEVTRL